MNILNNYFFQKFADNKTSTVKISNLPIIIVKDNIHLAPLSIIKKFPDGPTISPNPGPTLDIDVAAAEIDVIKSKPVSDNKAVNRKKITKYM